MNIMTPQAHKELVTRLLNEHLSAALNKQATIDKTIETVKTDLKNDNQYDRYLMGFTDDQRDLILKWLQLLLTMAAADVDEANAALDLQMKEKA